jgi:uncharacterized repeat protein (TIGR01451 family)
MRVRLAMCVFVLVSCPRLFAATAVWVGGSGTNWSTSANWLNGYVPQAGDDIVFPNSPTSLVNSNDLAAGLIVQSIAIGDDYMLPGNSITLLGSVVMNGGTAATITLPIVTPGSQPFNVGAGMQLAVAGGVSGAGGITKVGTGTLALPTGNTYTGGTTVSAGVLNIRANTSLGTGAATVQSVGALQLQGGITVSNSLTLAGAGGVGTGALENASATNTYSGPVTLSAASTISVDGAADSLNISGSITGPGGLTKAGAGSLQLASTNTYTGMTTVNAGTLRVDGTIGAVTLNAGTLSGIGTVGSVTANGGTVAPGDSPGVINTGNVTLTPAATLAVEIDGTIAGTQYDRLNVAGTATLGGATLNVILGYTPTPGDAYTIIQASTSVTGTFAGLPNGAQFCAGNYLFQINYGLNFVTLAAISPAPATHFSVSTPATTTAGSSFNVTVTALNDCGNVDTTYGGVVHFTSSDGNATLPANSTLTNGTGIFSVTLRTAGTQSVMATDTVASSITGSANVSVSAAAATHFTVSAPASATAGSAFNFTVTAQDQFNNTATGYGGTVHFTSTDGSATLPANSTLASGIGTFSATLRTVGNQTITATDTVTSSITGTSNAIAVTATADLAITKSGPSTANPNTDVTYTITVTNNGPSDAQSVTITDVLPAGTTFVSESQTTGPVFTCITPAAGGTGTISCSIATLIATSSATFSVVLHAGSATFSNVVSVSSATSDPNPLNNNASVLTGINSADLALTKTADAPLLFGGQQITYTIVVTNNGPSTATSVVVTDQLPAGSSFVSATPSGSCTGTSTVTCSIASIASGSTATITIVIVAPAAGGVVANTANVSAAQFDPIPANNAATATLTLQAATAIPIWSPTLLLLMAAMLGIVAVAAIRS